VTVRAKADFRNSIEAIRNIKVGYQTAAGNAYIPLSELANITMDTGSSYIYHERNQRFVPIKFSVRGRDLAGAVEEAQQRIAQNVTLPVGYRIQWAGEFEGMQQAQKRLALIVPVALVLILVLLYSLFNSLRDSLMALLGIPFSVAGGLIALYVSDLNFSISAAIGFVSLFGVSVMSGILIISAYHRVYSTNTSTMDAMFEAASQQMRPIMMMALSACIGLFPAAVSTGIGSQVQRPLATVVVGGMLVGPVLLLVIVPAVMSMILDWRRDRRPVVPDGERDLAST
jgi:heavy metal efflux system protein